MLDFRQQKKMPLGIRNNNPGNLRPGHDWLEAIGENKGFVVFSDIRYGLRALAMDLVNRQLRGLNTVKKIIDVYAPPVENNTKAYINAVAKGIGVKPTDELKLSLKLLLSLLTAIVAHENGPVSDEVITIELISEGISLMPEKLRKLL